MPHAHTASKATGYLQNALNYRDSNTTPKNAVNLLKITICCQKNILGSYYIDKLLK